MLTMTLIFKGNTAVVRTNLGDMTMGEALKMMLKKRRRALYSVCVEAKFEHSEAYRIRDDQSNSLKGFLRLSQALGYEIRIEEVV